MIYFIQAGENGPIKIGYTDKDPQERLKQLQTANPYELKLLWYFDGDMEDEQEIHKMFSHEKIRGEWFRPSRKIKEYMSSESAINFNHFELKHGGGLNVFEGMEIITYEFLHVGRVLKRLNVDMGNVKISMARDKKTKQLVLNVNGPKELSIVSGGV